MAEQKVMPSHNPSFDISLWFADTISVSDLYFETEYSLIATIGGYYSAVLHLTIFLVSPVLFWGLNKSIAKQIKAAQSLQSS